MIRSWRLALIVAFAGVAGVALAQSLLPVPSGIFSAGQLVVAQDANNLKGVPGGANVSNFAVYAQSITPSATSAAIQTAEQNFTVTGLATTDKVLINGPAPTSLCPMVHARVSAANTLTLAFSVLTAAACTPAAGTYNIIAIRAQ